MRKINLSDAVLALFKQNLTGTQIAEALKVSVNDIYEIMEVFVINDDTLPFSFKYKFDILVMPIKRLNFNGHLYNSLDRHGIKSLWEVCKLSKEELLDIRGLGKNSMYELSDFILKTLCDTNKNTPSFYDIYPNGISFNNSQIKALKENCLTGK